MVPTQNVKWVLPIFQASTTNGATASGNIDTLGYDYCTICVLLPTSDATNNNPSVLKISESDDTVVTNFATFTGSVGDTDFTIPNCETAATNVTQPFAVFNLRTGTRKRYLKLSVSPTTTQVLTAVAMLSRGEATPVGTAAQQAAVIVNI